MTKMLKKTLVLVLAAALCLTAMFGCLTVSAADNVANIVIGNETIADALGPEGGIIPGSSNEGDFS